VTLREQQSLFCLLVGQLILYAYDQGYELTFGDAYRSPEQAAANATSGAGIKNSLHTQRLAIDLLLFKDGVYLTDSAAYKPLGDYWKALSILNFWGGDFSKPDGNHFSSGRGGIK
jgi:hypothetical protein